jgi:hypothetical protein
VVGFHVTDRLMWSVVPLLIFMTIVRLMCKRWSGNLVVGLSATAGMGTSRGWGDGLAPQGILGLMVVLTFFHVWRDDVARSVLAAVALAGVINEIAAPWLIARLLKSVMRPRHVARAARGGAP